MAPFWLPKSTKIASWRPLGTSWARLGASWAHPVASWRPLGASWGVLERLGRILERLGGVLEASWGVLGASWAFQAPQERARWPDSELCFGPGNTQLSKKKRTTETSTDFYRPLDLFQRTPTRSWAPSGPVRIQQRGKAASPPPRLNRETRKCSKNVCV